MKLKIKRIHLLSVAVASLFVIIGSIWIYQNHQDQLVEIHEALLKKNLSEVITNKSDHWPKKIKYDDREYKVVYAFDDELTDYIHKLLKKKAADYSSIIVIDNNNGNVLSAVGYKRVGKKFLNNLPFTSTHPSASLIKIITAAELLERGQVNPNTVFSVNGKGSTLYKYQLRDKITRWTRYLSFKRAFALSNNVVFGKAAIKKITAMGITKMAQFFGFNTPLLKEVDMANSVFNMPENQYNLAEFASGLNRQTLISPVHGAVISTIVANDGIYKTPKLVEKVIDPETGDIVWENKGQEVRVIKSETGRDLQKMMSLTAERGTARRMWRRMKRSLRNLLFIGGKTGSITGGLPHGKRDWLTAFAMPESGKDKGISICVMNINKKKWYIKSTYLARKIIEFYYGKLNPLK